LSVVTLWSWVKVASHDFPLTRSKWNDTLPSPFIRVENSIGRFAPVASTEREYGLEVRVLKLCFLERVRRPLKSPFSTAVSARTLSVPANSSTLSHKAAKNLNLRILLVYDPYENLLGRVTTRFCSCLMNGGQNRGKRLINRGYGEG